MKMYVFIFFALYAAATASWAEEPAASTNQVASAPRRLMVQGQPFEVRGALGSDQLQEFARIGGNCILAPNFMKAGELLDQAQAAGLMAVVVLDVDQMGITNYADVQAIRAAIEKIREQVPLLKDHPSLLCWMISSRIRTTEKSNPSAYRLVNALARLFHDLDPERLVASHVGLLDEHKAQARLSAQAGVEVDALAFMLEPASTNLGPALLKAGWNKPFLLVQAESTGPEAAKFASWGAPLAPLTAENHAWLGGLLARMPAEASNHYLGSILFQWNPSAPGSARNWIPLRNIKGERSEFADALASAWSTHPPANHSPLITAITSPVSTRLAMPGGVVTAEVKATDPDGDPLSFSWTLYRELVKLGEQGELVSRLEAVDGAIRDPAARSIIFTTPLEAGPYWLFAEVRDGQGHASLASFPFMVQAVRTPSVKQQTPKTAPPPSAPEGEDEGAAVAGNPVTVTIEETGVGGGWQLKVDGTPLFVKGAGGKKHLEELKASGANAIRTWTTDFAGPVLDAAHKLGLKVCLGLWMKQERHGFYYNNKDAVDAQLSRLRAAVRRYRHHPALLMWCCGIEVEWGAGTNIAVYKAINDVARMVHEEDPLHPTTTAFADLGHNSIKAALAARYCPELDIFGVNSYGGLTTMADRLREMGWTRPYMIMEFGPKGQWEVPTAEWGAEVEQMPMDKAAFYLEAYNQSISSQDNWCLGSFVFSWDYKFECTPTWYSMHLADGTRMNTADTMWRAWSQSEPPNRCPEIRWMGSSLNRKKVSPNKPYSLDVDVVDPDNDPLTYQWVLMSESKKKAPDNTINTELKPVPGRITNDTTRKASLLTPAVPGAYRVFIYAYDGKGNASSANMPFFVEAR